MMRATTERLPLGTEYQEQVALMEWAAWQREAHPELKLLMHIPNGGYRLAREAARLRLMGVKPGVPDMLLPVARGGFHGLWIELKRVKNGVVSAAQAGWLEALRAQGYEARVCRGWQEAADAILEYLGGA